ncbi:hypothetical protein R1flu_007428 [Riccia fluitans]|uniref:Mediator of RNA polymerase II transcription subunit 11 n=1 Tax=Riccia fluitans TaxID=41844 RepID=A0ABD1Z1I5_9MARC
MSADTLIDAAIESQEIMLTVCGEAEKELDEGLKSYSVKDQHRCMQNVHHKINELQSYLYQTIDEIGWIVEKSWKGTRCASVDEDAEKHRKATNIPIEELESRIENVELR